MFSQMHDKPTGLGVAALAIGLALSACGGGASPTSQPTGQVGTVAAIEVTVTLSEFAVEMSQTDFEAGQPYRFVVTNDGAAPHELMFVRPLEPGSMDMGEMDEMAVAVFHADDLPAGATTTQTVTFPTPGEGSLEGACHLPGHYEAGMKLAISVSSGG